MLNNWLSPVKKELTTSASFNKDQYGNRMLVHTENVPELSRVKIALVGINEPEANAVRKQLYTYAYPFKSLATRVADLGNIRKQGNSFIIPLLKELLDSDIIPILIGKDVQATIAQFQAYSERKLVNLVVVDEKIRCSIKSEKTTFKNYLNDIVKKRKPRLLNLGLLGYQSHFTSPLVTFELEKKSFEPVRLGFIKQSMNAIEPVVRDADLMSINIAAIKANEAPGQLDPSPSGFTSEEICQISRYAGISDKLTSVGIYGYQNEKDINEQTAQILAQMIWYFIDGVFNRKNDYPASTDGLVEYIVEYKSSNSQIKFWKSTKSGRWWMEVPVPTKKKHQRHELIPCSYQDYQMACREDLPDRLLNAYHRFK